MATRRQREFRKQMKDIQRQQGRHDESDIYDYRSSHYRPRMKSSTKKWAIGGGSLVTLAIVAWNIFATSTWIPGISHLLHKPTTTAPSVSPQQAEVIGYLKLYTQDLNQVNAVVQEFASTQNTDNYPSARFQSTEKSLKGIELQLKNSSQAVAPVVKLGERLTEDAALLVTHQGNYRATKNLAYEQKVEQDLQAYDSLLRTQDAEISKVLRAVQIDFQIQADGTIHYQISGPST